MIDDYDMPEEIPVWTEAQRVALRAWQIAMRAYCAPGSSERVRRAAARYLLKQSGIRI